MLAVLIDPDKLGDENSLHEFLKKCGSAKVDFLFVGGSLLIDGVISSTIDSIKKVSSLPILLFPGDILQISPNADALLFLSLISGRNAELLIGKHVIAAPYIKRSGIECISTGYMLIDCGKSTTASYISQTLPIPSDKSEIAGVTAMTGEMMGLKMIYADGGSGAAQPIPEKMIRCISQNISVPLIIGGGITSHAQAENAWNAGADVVVIGTAFEKNPELISSFNLRK